MDISALQAFVAVAEHGSFSRASTQLFLTQPAISKRVATLESELGSRLFDRLGRQISLTHSGEALLPRARRILLELEDSRRAISNLTGQVAGALRIGTSHHIGLHRLPPSLRSYTARYPQVELDLQFMDSEAACRGVLHGDLELGLVTLPLESPKDLQAREIWPDTLTFIINRDHPLANKVKVNPSQLCQHAAILPAPGTYTREIIEQAFNPLGLQIPIRMSTNYLETIKMMVSVGLGWSILPDSMINDELVSLKVSGMTLSRKLGIVWHRGRTLSNAAVEMIKQIQDTD